MDPTELLLKELTEAYGIPGHEAQVRAIMRRHLEPVAEIEYDHLGGVIARRAGGAERPRVMVASHMDECGFMVRFVTSEGMIRFHQVSLIWDPVLLGQRVVIQTAAGEVIGVIGAKPIHLLPPEDRKQVIETKDMYIDIGATSAEEVAAAGVRIGDPIAPVSSFEILANPKTYMAKAFDDRVACALAIEALQRLAEEEHPNAVYVAGTVMEEIGCRGAATAAHVIDPDVALVLEIDFCGDVLDVKEEESPVKLGAGPTLVVFDRGTIPNLKLRDLVIDVASEQGIPLQLSPWLGGATDASRIHLHKAGVPSVALGVPTRHVHSYSGIIHRDDYDGALALLLALIKELDAETVTGLKDWET